MNNTPSEQNQRRFSRVPFVSQITLLQDNNNWQGTVVDICFNGILLSGKQPPIESHDMSIASVIQFENGIDINANLQLAHQHDNYYGFHFSEIDTDSLTHLRKLIMLNLGSEEACERELMTLFSYHQ